MIAASAAERILIVAPVGRDAELMRAQLEKAKLECEVFADVDALCHALDEGAGALLFTEEALPRKSVDQLGRALARQPAVGSSRVDLQACKLEYSIVSPK